jgi:thymidylate kinase
MSVPTADPPLPPARTPAEPAASALGTVTRLADALVRERISYCHWKSNAHLNDSVEGRTDLDLLIDRAHAQPFAAVLAGVGFKRFAATPWLAYPGVEDYLALDGHTGCLVHLHLHFELTLGERHLKGYRLPWERLVLGSRRLDDATGLYVAEPTIELLLLLVRCALKLRARDRVLAWAGRGGLDAAAQREYRWLIARANFTDFPSLTARLLGPAAADLVATLVTAEPTDAWLRELRRCARDELRGSRTYSPAGARVRAALREARDRLGAADRRWIRSSHPRVRTDPRGGVLAAIIGCDGAGKSTLVASTVSWLSWKLDAMPLYLGSGDGPASPLRWPMRAALGLVLRVRRWRAARPGRGRAPAASAAPGGDWAIARTIWALALSREKRVRLRRGVRARNRGLVVVCDRYPQAQIAGFNDGPLLSRWLTHPSVIARAIARWEAAPYEWAALHPPDLVIKLLVSPDVTLRRKPGMRPDDVRRRIEAVRQLAYPETAHVVEIDADAPLDRVLLQVKQAVWDRL